jgi:hypothetical protein
MVKSVFSISPVVLLLTLFLAPIQVSAEISAPFELPKPGVIFEYDDFKIVFQNSSDRRFRYSHSNGKSYATTSLFVVDPKSGANVSGEQEVHNKLWPLKVGNYIEFDADSHRGRWLFSVKVTGTEKIRLAGKDLETFVIEVDEESTVATYRKITTKWYSPELKYIVRSRSKVVEGPYYGRSRNYELIKYSPGNQ